MERGGSGCFDDGPDRVHNDLWLIDRNHVAGLLSNDQAPSLRQRRQILLKAVPLLVGATSAARAMRLPNPTTTRCQNSRLRSRGHHSRPRAAGTHTQIVEIQENLRLRRVRGERFSAGASMSLGWMGRETADIQARGGMPKMRWKRATSVLGSR